MFFSNQIDRRRIFLSVSGLNIRLNQLIAYHFASRFKYRWTRFVNLNDLGALEVAKEQKPCFSNVFGFYHVETVSLDEGEEVSSSSLNLKVVNSHRNIFFPNGFR